jgi:zinc protease
MGTLSAQQLQKAPMDTAIRYGKLSNGMTYYIRHNEQPKERAEFFIAQNVGAILEEDAQNGLAHFLEHMCFNGTQHFPGKSLLNYFESIGVKFGENINAYTSTDETVYNLSEIPTKTREGILDSALLVLHDWSCAVSLSGDEIDKERGVIREEWRQGRTASRRLMQARNRLMLPGSKYAIRDVIGDTAVINHFSYDELRSYYHKWYRPDLQAILVVGDVDVDQIEAKIKKLFSDIPMPENPATRTWFSVPDNDTPIVGSVVDPEMTSHQILLFWKKPAQPDAVRLSVQGYTLSRMYDLISVMASERMRNLCMEPNTPFSGATAGVGDLVRTVDAFFFQGTPVLGKEKEARERLLKEAEIIRRYGFTASELERAKTQMLSGIEKSYKERNQQKNNNLVEEYVRNFTQAEPCTGIEWEYQTLQQLLPKITVQDLNPLASSFLTDKNIVMTVIGPQKEGLAYPSKEELLQEIASARTATVTPYTDNTSNEPLIDKLPKSGKVKKEATNKEFGTTEWTLSNGIRVILKPTTFKEDEIRLVSFSDGGLSLVPEKDLVSANLMMDIIKQSGLGKFSKVELSKKLSGKIASISPSIGAYEDMIYGSSSVKDQETMFQLLYLYFTAPRRDDNAYKLLVEQIYTYLRNSDSNPQKAFSDSVSLITYNYHPRTTLLNLQTIKELDLNAVYRIYSERFGNPADFTFCFIGNMNPTTFKPLVEKYLGCLKTNPARETWKDEHIRYTTGTVRKDIVKPLQVSKSTNTIRYATEAPFNMTNMVLMTAISNILDLRYTETMREEEGATYGVSVSGLSTRRPVPMANLYIRFDTDPKVEEKMLTIVHSELETLATKGPKPEDLNKVQLNLQKQYKENVCENGWWVNALDRYYRDGLNFATDYKKAVDALSIEGIRDMAKILVQSGNRLEIILQPKP